MSFQGASSSSYSSFTSQWAHDVFLSFRGADTRNNFTAHLYEALVREGIKTYIDNNLEKGENISPQLLKVIEESRIAVIVLSQNYASSSWSLDELTKILECKQTKGQIVVPVFYKVDPTDVRHQRKSFGEAFVKHEERFKDDQKKVQKWKTDLIEVVNLSGCHLEDKNEPEFIREIIEWVNSKLIKNTYFQVAQHPIEIESHEQHLKSLLMTEKEKSTCMVGIFGTGGIGKTTIAKAIYNSIASQFEGTCFLENVRETSGQKDGMIHLQNKLLYKILGGSRIMVENVDQGITLINQRLCSKRILLVLDDVDHSNQLDKIIGKGSWFGLGSKIIITTRDKHLLRKHQVLTYKVKELNYYKALQLFCWHAFNMDKPNANYEEVTADAVRYAGGLPLALIVLGSALKDRDILYWKSKLDEYKRNPSRDIYEKLKISFDALDENAKNIFLDIACFFKGKNVEYVTEILDSCGFHSYSSIEELKDKCLITIDFSGSLTMHDLLQEMGREIVRQESPKEPGQRSRLWFHEDVRDVLEEATGTNNVEGILIDFPARDQIRDQIHLNPKAFKKMKKLRILIIRKASFSEEPNFFFKELRLLDWCGYPGQLFPSNSHGKNLAVLRMHYSHLKGFGEVQNFPNLTRMDFRCCKFIEEIPDVSKIPNLKKLVLDYCKKLVKIHHSVGLLDKLKFMSLRSCSNLRSLPRSLKLISLEILILQGCSRLKNFLEIECQIKCLQFIDLGNTSIKQLKLKACSKVVKFLSEVKDNRQSMPANVYMEEFAIFSKVLPNTLKLSLKNCELSKSNFFSTFDCPSASYILDLSGSDIVTIPQCIESFVGLKYLDLSNCRQLREIQGLPPNVVYMEVKKCVSLAIFLEEARSSQLFNMSDPVEPIRSRTGFPALQSNCPFNSLQELDLSFSAVVRLPTWFNRFVGLKRLTMTYCKQFREIPELPPNLETMDLSRSDIIILPRSIESCVGLKFLYLKDCKQLREIQGLPPNVVTVSATGCVSLAIFFEEATRSKQFNLSDPPEPIGSGTGFPALQSNCPFNSLQELDLSSSAVVRLPIWFNRFVGLKRLTMTNCKQFREILELPPNVERVDLSRSDIIILPRSIESCVGLKFLCLEDCKQLREI